MSDHADEELLRTRDGRHAQVGYVELFFDLVFVFAVTQLSHNLIKHPTPLGLAQTAILIGAMWWGWINTAWATNWLEPNRLPVRLLLFAMLAVGILMSAAIPKAFEARGWVFGLAFAAFQVGRTAFVLAAIRNDAPLKRNFQRILVWHGLAAVAWIVGGFLDPGLRLAVWVLALGIESLAPAVSFWAPGLGRSTTSDWTVDGAHIAERCALFIIIALGESVLVIGATVAGLDWTPAVMVSFASAILTAVAMWWIYFAAHAEAAADVIAKSDDPGRIARLAYTYIHLWPVAGIVFTAVGDEWVLAHPEGHADVKTALAVLGGPALFLAGVALFKLAVFRQLSFSRLAGIGALAVVAPFSPLLSPMLLSVLATAVLVLVGVWESIALARGAKSA